jgi:maltooligosyltrehalose trehalohydrolase
MPDFAVWAPRAARVDLHLDERQVAMQPSPDGWWRVTDPDAGPGSRYGFRLDDRAPRPDPRSASQPDGIDGLSQILEHHAFTWSDQGWGGMTHRDPVLYELHIGTFTPAGTFDAAIERLGHLVDLGVGAIEMLPIVEFSGERGWGYDGVDLFAPHHAYGGPDGLKRLIDACHAAGLGVVIDAVYNHLGPAGNYLDEFGPYFSDRYQTNWGAAVNFDGPGSHEVRRFVVDNALMWLRDYHADGLRLDAVHAIVDRSAYHILEQLAEEVDDLATHLSRPLLLIAESDLNDPRFVRDRDAGGFGLDAAWADEWHHALHASLTGERQGYYEDFGPLALLAKGLRQAWVYDGTWSPHRQRRHGRPPAGLNGAQFVVSTQNHDQIGNRALGERSGALMSHGRLQIAAALLLTGPFIPMLFQGEEWAASSPFQYFTDHRDPALARAVTDGRRQEFAQFGWDPKQVPDPQDYATFLTSKLDWAEIGQPLHSDVLAWYRRLIELRRAKPGLHDRRLDRITVDVDETTATLVVGRPHFRILVNLGAGDHRFPLPSGAVLLAASNARILVSDAALLVPADAVALVEIPGSECPPVDRDAAADALAVGEGSTSVSGIPSPSTT